MVLCRDCPECRKDLGESLRVGGDLKAQVSVVHATRAAKVHTAPCTRSITTPRVWFSRICESGRVTSPRSETISSIAAGRNGTKTVLSKSHVSPHLARLLAAVSRIAVSVDALRPRRWIRSE